MHEEIKVHVVKRKDQKNLFMRYTDPNTGRQISKSTLTTRKKKAAMIAGAWQAELQEGRYKSVSKVTWAEFRDRYEHEHLPSLAEKTFDKVSSVFNSIENILKPDRLCKLTSERISFYQNEMRKLGRSEQTIKGHLQHLKAGLNWAKQMGMIYEMPQFKMPHRAKSSKMMKGRPVTGEEFDRMIAVVNSKGDDENPAIIKAPEDKASWVHLLKGLWWSGLRLEESLELTWDDHEKLRIDLMGEYPMMLIPADHEKGNQDRLLPITPEFAEMILATPEEERTGYFFNPAPRRKNYTDRMTKTPVGRIISAIGEKAGIKVSKEKFASAHDLRRSFGERWSTRVMPQVLMQMMRHETIETTMKYYVGRNAETAARAMYSSINSGQKSDSASDFDPINEKRTHAEST